MMHNAAVTHRYYRNQHHSKHRRRQRSEGSCVLSRNLFSLCIQNLQTPTMLQWQIFRDTHMLSGCCLQSFAFVWEACQRNGFFTPRLQLTHVCDVANLQGSMKASENSEVAKMVN
ncbi:uncharacterized protein MONOS_17206 [Monocercomonoides exilis]|uniref:uncharacterized protein n=1 Tax=Monocercomonoides exilis TaxID=2049356 RepID=UPI003559E533|nr:hypothetical protein MONOS_17206 [Monocercomonoides exilis]